MFTCWLFLVDPLICWIAVRIITVLDAKLDSNYTNLEWHDDGSLIDDGIWLLIQLIDWNGFSRFHVQGFQRDNAWMNSTKNSLLFGIKWRRHNGEALKKTRGNRCTSQKEGREKRKRREEAGREPASESFHLMLLDGFSLFSLTFYVCIRVTMHLPHVLFDQNDWLFKQQILMVFSTSIAAKWCSFVHWKLQDPISILIKHPIFSDFLTLAV